MKEVSYFYEGENYKEAEHETDGTCFGCTFYNGHCYRPEEFPKGCGDRDTIWIKVGDEQLIKENLKINTEITNGTGENEFKIKEVELEPKATDIQEGGSHYKEMKIQPVEYIHGNNLNFFEGNVVKYVTRHRSKNGAEDIKKAIHYLNLILQLEYNQ